MEPSLNILDLPTCNSPTKRRMIHPVTFQVLLFYSLMFCCPQVKAFTATFMATPTLISLAASSFWSGSSGQMSGATSRFHTCSLLLLKGSWLVTESSGRTKTAWKCCLLKVGLSVRVENREIKLLCTVDFMIREGGMRRNRRTTARLVSHTSPRNRFTAERSSVSEENKGRALCNLGIILSFSPPSALPPRSWKALSPFHKRIRSASRLDGSQIFGSFN